MTGKPRFPHKRSNFSIEEIARVSIYPERYTKSYLKSTYGAAVKRLKPSNISQYTPDERFICAKAKTIIKAFLDTRQPAETGLRKYTTSTIKRQRMKTLRTVHPKDYIKVLQRNKPT